MMDGVAEVQQSDFLVGLLLGVGRVCRKGAQDQCQELRILVMVGEGHFISALQLTSLNHTLAELGKGEPSEVDLWWIFRRVTLIDV